MASIQQQIDQMLGSGFSATNLALNIAGTVQLANNGKKVFIATNDKDNPKELLVSSAQDGLGFAAEYVGLNSVIMYAEVKESSKICEHPLEDGSVIADHQIQMPVEIRLQIVMPYYFYDTIVTELRNLKEQGTLVSVHTQGGIYTDMVFVDIPHKEDVSNVDRLSFDCTLKQAILVKGERSILAEKDVIQKSNASTVKSGTKQGKTKSILMQGIESVANLYVKTFG